MNSIDVRLIEQGALWFGRKRNVIGPDVAQQGQSVVHGGYSLALIETGIARLCEAYVLGLDFANLVQRLFYRADEVLE